MFIRLSAQKQKLWIRNRCNLDGIHDDGPNFLKKLDSFSASGALSAWGALTTFSCKYGPEKNFFYALGGAHAPSAPTGYAYACRIHHRKQFSVIFCYSFVCELFQTKHET